MPHLVIPAALGTASAVATTGISSFAFLGFQAGMQSIMASFLSNVALGYALNSLAPKPQTGISGGGYGINVNQLGSTLPTATIYGEQKVGGVVFYQEVVFNTNLYQMIAFADHEIDSYQKIFMNDEEITETSAIPLSQLTSVDTVLQLNGEERNHGGASAYAERKGEAGQAYVPILGSANNWDESHTATGVAYLAFRHTYDRDRFPNGTPVISAVVRGKKLYDPRDGTTAWSDNPALCLRDYLISSGIADEDEIDDDLFKAAANVCDETVTLAAGGTQKRYTCNGSFTSDEAASTVINSILATMGGMIWYSNGKWSVKAAAFTSSVLTLDEDDLRSPLSIQTRNSRRDGFNQVIGIFRGAESNYQPTNFPEVTSQAFLDTDNGKESTFELNLPFVDTASQAQRIAKIALYRNREQLKISGSFGMRALQVGVGDIVKITNSRLGFTEKLFEVTEWTFGLNNEMALEVSMSLQEISSEIFEWDADETAFESNNTSLLSPFYVPNVGFTTTNIKRVINEHVTNVLAIDVTSSNPEFIDRVEVEYNLSSTSTLFADTWVGSLSSSLWSDTYWSFSPASSPTNAFILNSSTGYLFFGWETGSANETFFDPLTGTVATNDELTIVPVGSSGVIKNLGEATIKIDYIEKITTASGKGYFRVRIKEFVTLSPEDGLRFRDAFSTSFVGDIWFKYRFTSSQDTDGFVRLGSGPLGRFEIPDTSGAAVNVSDIPNYFIRARAISTLGIKGPFTSANTAYNNDTTGPSAVTDLNKQINGNNLTISWTPSSDNDLSHYKILFNHSTSGSFLSNNTQVIVEKIARPSVTAVVPAIKGTYFIVPYDKNGNEGDEASIVVNADDLRSYANESTRVLGSNVIGYSWPTGGTYTNCAENETFHFGYYQGVTLTDYATAPSEGSYEEPSATNYIDVGSDKLCRVSFDIVMYRYIEGSNGSDVQWDSFTTIPIDSWPRSYGINTFSSEIAMWHDIECQAYVRTALNAAPTTYGDWKPARGEVFGRRFNFKFVLKSKSNNVSPYLGKVTFRVEYD